VYLFFLELTWEVPTSNEDIHKMSEGIDRVELQTKEGTMAITKNTEYKIVTSKSDYLEIEPNEWSISVYERSSYDNSISQSYDIQYETIDELIEVLTLIKKEREEQV
jgi:hypothetical protein